MAYSFQLADMLMQNKNKINFTISCRANEINEDTIIALKYAGLTHVSFGIETVNPDSLLLLEKKQDLNDYLNALNVLTKFDLSFSTYMMIYHPFTSIGEIYDNYRFLKTINAFNTFDSKKAIFSLLYQNKTVVRKYTRMEKILNDKKLLYPELEKTDYPMLCYYNYLNKNVNSFTSDLWKNAKKNNFKDLLTIFEETISKYINF